MPRPRHLAIAGALVLSLTVSPLAAAVAFAADPAVTVNAGDTLTSIARRAGVTIDQLVEANGIVDPNRIYAGQRLLLPGADATLAKSQPAAPAIGAVHVVRSGESVWGIARHYGTTVAAIAAANAMVNPAFIVSGQRLTIPGFTAPQPTATASTQTPASAPASGGVVHVVRSGESVWGIARQYGTTVATIAAANGMVNPAFIVSGQRLTIPGATMQPASPAARKPMPGSLATTMAARDSIRRMIVAEAEVQGVPAAFALAVAWQESGWQPGVVSSAGAVGVMQLLPTTADWVSEAMLDGATVDLYDARSNIRAGIRLLAFYLDRYDGNRDLTLAAYYQGMTAVERHGIYPVSRPYIGSIRALEQLLGS